MRATRFFRWPLDHIFTSKEFYLNTLEVGANIGSDHLPVFTEIRLSKRTIRSNPIEDPTKEELKNANLIIRAESKEDSPEQ